MYTLFVCFVFIFVAVVAKVIFDVKEAFTVPEYLHHKSRCFDCESQMIAQHGQEGAWMANPAKTFSAESQGVAMGGLEGGFIAKTMKYY